MKKLYVLFFLSVMSLCATAQQWTMTEGPTATGFGYMDDPSLELGYIGGDESGTYLRRVLASKKSKSYELVRFDGQMKEAATAMLSEEEDEIQLGGFLNGDEVVAVSMLMTEKNMKLMARHYEKQTLDPKGNAETVYELPIPTGCKGAYNVRSSREGDLLSVLMLVYSKQTGNMGHVLMLSKEMEVLWDMELDGVDRMSNFLVTEEGEVVLFGASPSGTCEMHVMDGKKDLKRTCKVEDATDLRMIGYARECVLVVGATASRNGLFAMSYDMKKDMALTSTQEFSMQEKMYITHEFSESKQKHFKLPEYALVRASDYDSQGASAIISESTHVTGDFEYYTQSSLIMVRVNTEGRFDWLEVFPSHSTVDICPAYGMRCISKYGTRMQFNEVVCRDGKTYFMVPERTEFMQPVTNEKIYKKTHNLNWQQSCAFILAFDENGKMSNLSQSIPKGYRMLGGLHYTGKDRYDQLLLSKTDLMVVKWVIE